MWNGESSPNSITKNISDRQFDARIFDKLNLKIVFPKIAQKRQNMTKIEIKFPNFCSAMKDFFISCYTVLFKLNWSIISVTSIGRPGDLKALQYEGVAKMAHLFFLKWAILALSTTKWPQWNWELDTSDVIFSKYVGDIRKWGTWSKHFLIGMNTLGLMNWLQIKLTAKYAENLTTFFNSYIS